jgi:hypothetical protein
MVASIASGCGGKGLFRGIGELSGSSTGFPKPFINIKFHGSPFARGDRGNPTAGLPVIVPAKTGGF